MKQLQIHAGVALALISLTVLLLLMTFAQPQPSNGLTAQTIYAAGEESTLNHVANCRYGVSPLGGDTAISWVSSLGAGWYLTFGATPPNNPPTNDAEFAHVIRTQQDQLPDGTYLPTYTVIPELTEAGLGSLISSDPGALWLVGNEVDRGPDPGELTGGQDHTFPDVYATAYNEVYNFITQRDPSARVAISGLVEVTPGRLQYLDKVWEAYKTQFGQTMPVDVWNMHLYILPETEADGTPNGIANVALGTDPALGIRYDPTQCTSGDVYCFYEHDDLTIFAEQIIAMRTWMKSHGQQNKPLIISEYSQLYPVKYSDGAPFFDENGEQFLPPRVSSFMLGTFDYMNNQAQDPNLGYSLDNDRLVQQWLWFSTYSSAAGSASNLLDNNLSNLTQVGQAFQSYVLNEPLYGNLMIERVSNSVTMTNGSMTADVPLSVSFRNNGNTSITATITVTFFSDAAMTTPIGASIVQPPIRGCATSLYFATVVWIDRAPGVYPYWVRIDSDGNVNGKDNVGTGFAFVDPAQIFLPIIIRN